MLMEMSFLKRTPRGTVIIILVLIIIGLVLYIMTHHQTMQSAAASLRPFKPRWNQPHALDIGGLPGTETGILRRKEGRERGVWVGEQTEHAANQLGAKVVDNENAGALDRDHLWKPVAAETVPVLASRNSDGWAAVVCDPNIPLRKVTQKSPDVGNFRMYVYNSSEEDASVTRNAIAGNPYFERDEISRFLNVSYPLPIIDVGANMGLITLQAAKQGRQVVAVEPSSRNALRLCRSVVDFGHASLVHVIQNAVSSKEGSVSLTLPGGTKARTWYTVHRGGDGANGEAGENDKKETKKSSDSSSETVFAIGLDRLLDVVPFAEAAVKIDVEGHEGHVVAKADRLFQELKVHMVWMEWEHVKSKPMFGGAFVVDIMKKHSFFPYDLMKGQPLSFDRYLHWPFTVLWKKKFV